MLDSDESLRMTLRSIGVLAMSMHNIEIDHKDKSRKLRNVMLQGFSEQIRQLLDQVDEYVERTNNDH